MPYLYIGAIVIGALLIGLGVLAILWISHSVNRSINSRTHGLISEYDQLIEEKSKLLASLEEKCKEREEALAEETTEEVKPIVITEDAPKVTSSVMNTVWRISEKNLWDDCLAENYRAIRKYFSTDMEWLAAYVKEAYRAVAKGPATAFLEELSKETVYQLATLPQNDQVSLLTDCVNEEQKAFLREYIESKREFDIFGFYEFMERKASEEEKPLIIRLGQSGEAYKDQMPEWAEVVIDPNICEGYQLISNHVLYDYAVTTREIS